MPDGANGHFVPVRSVDVNVYTIPTDLPESDGTLEWDSTTMVLVQVSAGNATGLGYTYNHSSTAALVQDKFAPLLKDRNALDVTGCWDAMAASVRNFGRSGIASSAISAVDIALWDLKARLLELPLCSLLGQVRGAVPLYGSGGFCSYSNKQLQQQLSGWVDAGIPRVKMKVGRDPAADPERVHAARKAIGDKAELFVDANGAYSRKQALSFAELYSREYAVSWFEEPVASNDREGLRLLRDRAPAGMDIAAGEYGWEIHDFTSLLDDGCVDVLQADATRCGGITGFLMVDGLCIGRDMPLSAHTAPMAHLHVCCASHKLRHLEYFHDHVRIEKMLFDGVPAPVGGELRPDLSRPGIGLELKLSEARRFAA